MQQHRKYHSIQKQRDMLRELNRAAYLECPCSKLEIYSRENCTEAHSTYYTAYMRVFDECVRLGLNYYESELNDTQTPDTDI